jgi:hypothetical protein
MWKELPATHNNVSSHSTQRPQEHINSKFIIHNAQLPTPGESNMYCAVLSFCNLEMQRGCKRMQKTSLLNHPSPPEFFGVNFVRSKISPETFSKFGQICTRKTKFSRNFPISNDKRICWKKKFTELHLSWVFNLLNNEEIVLKRGKMYCLRQNYMTK